MLFIREVTSTGHGLSTGDYVVIRNMSEDYSYVSITSTGTNTFTATVASSGDLSGSDGAYIPAAKATSVSETAATIASPTVGNIQILGLTITNGGLRSSGTLSLTMPADIENGSGGNTSSDDINPPVATGYLLSDGSSITPTVTLYDGTSSASNYNKFSITNLNIFSGDVMVKLSFN